MPILCFSIAAREHFAGVDGYGVAGAYSAIDDDGKVFQYHSDEADLRSVFANPDISERHRVTEIRQVADIRGNPVNQERWEEWGYKGPAGLD